MWSDFDRFGGLKDSPRLVPPHCAMGGPAEQRLLPFTQRCHNGRAFSSASTHNLSAKMRRLLSQPVSRGGAAHSIWPGTATRGPAGPKLSLPFDPTLAGKVPGAAAKFNVLHACPLEEKPAAAHRPLRCHPRPAPGRGQSRAYLLLQLARTQEECASLNQEVQNLVARAHLAPEAARPDADESELAQLEIENSALESELAAATTKLRQLEEEAAFKLSRQRMLFDESCQRAAQELEREFTALYESNDELVIDYLHKVFEQLQGKASLPSVA